MKSLYVDCDIQYVCNLNPSFLVVLHEDRQREVPSEGVKIMLTADDHRGDVVDVMEVTVAGPADVLDYSELLELSDGLMCATDDQCNDNAAETFVLLNEMEGGGFTVFPVVGIRD